MESKQFIAERTGMRLPIVEKVLSLFNEGNTIPFIARYRKEVTQSLDEVQLAQIEKYKLKFDQLEQRKVTILSAIEEQGKLSSTLKVIIEKCYDELQLEDIYAPYKRKRKSKADTARALGLEPLAKLIMAQKEQDLERCARRFIRQGVENSEDAIEHACNIIKEWMTNAEGIKERFRETYRRYGVISSSVKKNKSSEASTYRDYFDYQEKLDRCPSHRYLAIMRGEAEGLLSVKLSIDVERAEDYMQRRFTKRSCPYPDTMYSIAKQALKEYILPSVENQVRKEYKQKADEEAIKVFVKNLEQILLAPPVAGRPILAIDPGFRTGCKVACIDERGALLKHDVIYPHPPQKEFYEAGEKITQLVEKYKIQAIAIGNGTASRETEHFIKHLKGLVNVDTYVISESGASIYSASEVARKEFPKLDLTVRGAISLARRLQDPLSEIIKVDPKSIGVGQYQHDVDQAELKRELDHTVISCVNRVGVDLNTASPHLLNYISGLGETLASNIVDYRSTIDGFKDLSQLKEVPRLGDKAFEQCAGFLRIREGNNVLDNTGIHPESYPTVQKIAQKLKVSIEDLINDKNLLTTLDNKAVFEGLGVGKETMKDIIDELKKPGHDPRGKAEIFQFDPNVKSIEDVHMGMRLPGIVSNITNFGAFVNIGVKQDGLIHVSQMADRRINDPHEVLALDQKVIVRVVEVDIARNRISLSLK